MHSNSIVRLLFFYKPVVAFFQNLMCLSLVFNVWLAINRAHYLHVISEVFIEKNRRPVPCHPRCRRVSAKCDIILSPPKWLAAWSDTDRLASAEIPEPLLTNNSDELRRPQWPEEPWENCQTFCPFLSPHLILVSLQRMQEYSGFRFDLNLFFSARVGNKADFIGVYRLRLGIR